MGESSCFDCAHQIVCRLHYCATVEGTMQSTDLCKFCKFFERVPTPEYVPPPEPMEDE